MKADFPWDEIEFDYSKEDVAEVCRKLRTDRSLTVGQLAPLVNNATKYIEGCENGSSNSFVLLLKLLNRYENLEAKITIRNVRTDSNE